ncbi:diguanylate cyclase (plasmid) [Deinococcus psychrotolerans]|uniref:Diguanylate cyclase n=1 Tax=Deinococcus psychrotolerans TaxID=2489213 RepID=A0A3G8YHQ8_9DEIO|nr:diguanylate cyclase [Deinococcus psychrotolerans]AZI44808.1 diguanylate cyclase [Deinococcus psychrotolerans]
MTGALARILVVDDNDSGRYVTVHTLKRAGYLVSEARSGAEALSLLVNTRAGMEHVDGADQMDFERPDLIVLDINMPDMDGFEVCRRIKADVGSAQIPVLMASASYLTAENTAYGLDLGADAYLAHPIEPSVLIATLRALLRVRAAEAEVRQLNLTLERRVLERTGELQRLSEELQVQVRELEERNTEAKVLSEMSEMLQACFSFSEIEQVVALHVALLFPGVPGKLYSYGASKDGLEELVAWNGKSTSTSLFGPEECWGLRRGRLFASVEGELNCHHHQTTGSTLCVPMLAQGDTVGLLYLERETAFPQRQQRLAQTVADMVALAMVNLRLRETLRQQSIRDPLTGLFNRRYLEETFERELRRSERKGEAIGLIMLDVDRFKVFNDTHGHEAGDVLLKALGGVLRESVRAEDVACRYGGEEFTLLLPGANQQQTFDRAEQIREAIVRLKVTNQGKVLEGVSASLGVATFPQHGRELAVLVRAADLALYRAKREGRNRVVNAE